MIRASFAVTDPDVPIRPYLGGFGEDIPIIEFGDAPLANFEVTVNSRMLTPEEQVAWLRRLSAAAEELAEQVEQRHGMPPRDGLIHISDGHVTMSDVRAIP